jgi:4-carboxymuconolactone decarboxylase
MAISAAAKSQHDQLFGDRVSALAQSGPELIGYFGNFAFDEVHADAARLDETLGLHTRLMVQLAAILAAGGLAGFRVMAAAAVADGGVSPVESRRSSISRSPTSAGARQGGAGPHCRRRRGGRSPHRHPGG